MGKYTGTLLCSDFDGTLFHQRQISPENADAIHYFQREGGLFTIASGRFPRNFRDFEHIFISDVPIIALGGSIIYDRIADRLLYEGLMDPGSLEFIRFVWESYPHLTAVHLYSDDSTADLTRESGEAFENFLARVPAKIYKCVFSLDRSQSEQFRDEMQEKYGDRFYFSRAWYGGLEMQSIRDNKGEAVKRLRTLLGECIKRVACVGDFENDISMFGAADISFAVKGGSPLAAAAADRLTVPCAEHAIADVIGSL